MVEGAKQVGRETKPAADKMHDTAKGFGVAIWEGMKSMGRALGRVFTGGS